MPALFYTESPLNPLCITRHRPDAGLAFEKHRWLFPTREDPDTLVSLFNFGVQPLREIYVHDPNAFGEPVEALPLALSLNPEAIPNPPLHFTVVFERQTNVPRIVDTLVTSSKTPVYLVFSQALIPPYNQPPRQTNALIENILGHEWDGNKNPGWVPLIDAEIRHRALQALGTKNFHRLYLVAAPAAPTALPPQTLALFEQSNGLTKVEEPEIDYRLFHALVSKCDWILTSHGNIPGVTPFCFYSTQDLRAFIPLLSPKVSQMLVEIDDIEVLNQAANIKVNPRGGLTLSEIVPLEMIAEATELSLAWSDLDRLDELPALNTLRHVDLDGTVIDDLRPLIQMPQLESLSLRCLQLTTLQPLTFLPSLQQIALSRVPIAGLSELAAIPRLTSLNLDLLPIDNLRPLIGCQGLKDISLNYTPLKQLDEIAQIFSLERLSICSTAITNITPLTALPNLKELLMDGCALEDLVPLAEIEALTTFSLAGLQESPMQLPDLSPLGAMQGLKHLTLYNTTLENLPSGSLVSTLETLDISATLTSELRWLTTLEVLRELEIADVEAPDLSPLGVMSSLEALNVAGCKVADLAWLKELVQLRVLNLNLTKITDLRPIAHLSRLRSLYLGGASIDSSSNSSDDSWNVLSVANELEELNLSGLQLGSPLWLADLKQLRVLDLSYTDFENCTLLCDMIHLTDLNVSETPIRTLNGLTDMQKLLRLNLNNTTINNLSPISLATELEELSLRNTSINDLRVISGMKQLQKLDLRGIPNIDCDFSPLLELPRLRLLRLESHGINHDVLCAIMQRHRVIVTPT
jgi:internalin A